MSEKLLEISGLSVCYEGIETHAVHRGGAPYRKRNMEDDQTPYSAESCGADDCHSGA